MPRVGRKSAYKHVSNFGRGRIAAYRYCGLNYCSFAARFDLHPMNVCRIYNLWLHLGHTMLCRIDLLSMIAEKNHTSMPLEQRHEP